MPHPPFDPDIQAALALLPPDFNQAIQLDNLAEVRTYPVFPVPDNEALSLGGTVRVAEQTIPGPDGEPDLSVLILSPAEGTGPWPGLYHIHGGGMILGNNRFGLDELAEWVTTFGFVIVSVEYRLAPEHPHPAPVEDCYAGLAWTAKNAAELGIDPDRLAVIGGSAGGGLAAATALLARDRGGPRLSHQILLCPMLDDREITVSSQELDGEGVWDRNANRTGWSALLGDARGGPDVSPYAAPARAIDLSGLPPAYIDVGQVDTFRDEDLDYAARLSRAGVPVEFHLWPGGCHGFEGFAPQSPLAHAAKAARLNYIRRAFGV